MRVPLREQLESDLSVGNQADDKHRETSHDRIQGLAYASTLGIALKQLRAEENARHLHKAIDALDQALQHSTPYAKQQRPDDLTNLAKVAILEWLRTACGRCEGRGWVVSGRRGAPRVDCPKCEQAPGRHRYTQGDRARAFGRRLAPSQEKLLELAHDLLRDHDELAASVVRRLVDRP